MTWVGSSTTSNWRPIPAGSTSPAPSPPPSSTACRGSSQSSGRTSAGTAAFGSARPAGPTVPSSSPVGSLTSVSRGGLWASSGSSASTRATACLQFTPTGHVHVAVKPDSVPVVRRFSWADA